jgi:5-methyltetrahydropteroyltriglutamate--homocysteine methyltransferase
VAEQLFGTVPVDRFLLEYDGERADGFESLRFVRPEAVVVLGQSKSDGRSYSERVSVSRCRLRFRRGRWKCGSSPQTGQELPEEGNCVSPASTRPAQFSAPAGC